MRCTTKLHLSGGETFNVGAVNGSFQCGAEKGHNHAHVTMDEASGGIIFWILDKHDRIQWWWFRADHTEEQLAVSLEMSMEHNAPVPPGITYELFRQARGSDAS